MDVLLPQLAEPFMMMDFLNKSYAKGSIFSILALNGIFIEITKFNLDFPQFYKRLYSLFDTGVLHTRYRAEFFKLSIRFMFSKYLPSYPSPLFLLFLFYFCLFIYFWTIIIHFVWLLIFILPLLSWRESCVLPLLLPLQVIFFSSLQYLYLLSLFIILIVLYYFIVLMQLIN